MFSLGNIHHTKLCRFDNFCLKQIDRFCTIIIADKVCSLITSLMYINICVTVATCQIYMVTCQMHILACYLTKMTAEVDNNHESLTLGRGTNIIVWGAVLLFITYILISKSYFLISENRFFDIK